MNNVKEDPNFFVRLYRGYEGESLVSAELYARTLESFRLPADFGFDLVVSNAFARTFSSAETTDVAFPWLLQVKSRRIHVDEMVRLGEPASGRYEAKLRFDVSSRDWDRLKSTDNGFLVFVVIIVGEMPWGQLPRPERRPSKLTARHIGFVWFGCRQLTFLEPFLASSSREFELELRYRSRPTGRMREHFNHILEHIPDDCADARDKLAARMPEFGEVPMNATDYFSVWDEDGNSARVSDRHLSLSELGIFSANPSPFS